MQSVAIDRIDDATGGTPDGTSGRPSISADGRYVAFASFASDLVAGDTNGQQDIFIADRQTGTVRRIGGDNFSSSPSISGDGRYVTYTSSATDLVAGDDNGNQDVFVTDLQTGTTERIGGNQQSASSSISADGRYVAFRSLSSDLVAGDTNDADDIFVLDRQTGAIQRIGGNAGSANPSISADGRHVAFTSAATDLVASDTNGFVDVFVADLQTGSIQRFGGNRGAADPSLSSDGRYLAFSSTSTNLVTSGQNASENVYVADLQTGALRFFGGSSRTLEPSISADGRYLAFSSAALDFAADDTNGILDVFRADLQTGAIQRVGGNGVSFEPSISADGRVVAFSSVASDFVPGDTAGQDVFVADFAAPNQPPAGTDASRTIDEDTTYSFTAADFGFTDPQDNPPNAFLAVRITFVPGPVLRLSGVVVQAGQVIPASELGNLTLTPQPNDNGLVILRFEVQDDGGTENGGADFDPTSNVFSFSVTAINDPPVAVDDTGTTVEDTQLIVRRENGLLANDSDVDANDLRLISDFRIAGYPTVHASNTEASLGAAGTITIFGDGGYIFIPAPNYAGPVPVITYTLVDRAGFQNPQASSDTATLTLSITPVNDAPNALADSGSTSENTPVTIAVLANDTDIENNPLTAAVATAPGNGTATVLPDGRIQYTPNAGFVGTDTFTYRANDGTDNSNPATVTVAVSTRGAINGTPLADTLTGTEGRDSLNGLAGNDVINALGGDDTVDGGPGADQMRGGTGNDTYIVDDFSDQVIEAAGEGTDTIRTGLAAYTMPTGSEVENLVYTGTGGFTGNGNQLANAITGGNADDSLNGLGGNDTLNGLNGNDSLSGMDGQDRLVGGLGNDTLQGGLDGDTFVFDTPLNAANNVDRIADLTSGVDRIELSGIVFTGLPTGPLAAGAFDRVGDATAATAATRIIYDPNVGTLSFDPDGTGAQAAVLFARVNPFQALVASDFVVTNGANAPVNTAPVANNDTGSGVQGNPISGNVLGNDTDAENNPLTATLQASASNGTVLLNANGSYTYTPNASFTGTDSFSYRASDGTASSNVATVSLTVNPPGLIAGGPGNDTLNGTPGPDTIDGGAGIDTMRGFAGDDVYLVDSPADQVIEAAGQGTDTIRTALAQFTLATNPEVENLTYTGVQGFNGQGNGGNNVITGGVGIDVLDGAGGNDTLNGLQGNDTLLGQAGTDRLAGGIGNDTLAGGTEADTFVFDTALNATTNVDRVTDFTPGSDKLELDDAVFAGLAPGALNANAFDRLGDATAATAATRIIYDPATGNLFFDADGNGAQAAVQFATLNANLNLQASDVNVA